VRGGGVGLQRPGCWATHVSAPPAAILPLPDTLPFELAATFFQPTCAAYIALHDVAQLGEGETVIVVGAAGAVGSQVVQLALAAGADVIGVVGRPGSLGRVPPGARALAIGDEAAVAALAADRPGTLLVDTLGGPDLVGRLRWVRGGGRAVIVGYVHGMTSELQIPTWMMDDVALLPMNMLSRDERARALAPELAGRVDRGELVIELEHVALSEVPAALSRLSEGAIAGRAVVRL
jgi:NADPH2:quinone reductase